MPRPLGWALFLVAAASAASAAQPRVPQVPVSGTALADYFASVGEAIDVHRDQLDLQAMGASTFTVGGYTTDAGDTIGVYSNHVLPPTPERYPVLPGDLIAAPYELHALATFRRFPARLSVQLLDVFDQALSSRTYFAGPPDGNHFGPPDASNFGFYIQRSDGALFYTQDSRNAGSAPRILVFAGTGYNAGSLWLACETGQGSGGDFADFIAFIDLHGGYVVPVSRTSWGELKRRFR